MKIVQVVKNYAPNGGMEEYVYRLCNELAVKGNDVTVLCQSSSTKSSSDVEVVELGTYRKPHWISHFRFSAAVDHWLNNNLDSNRIVHSHERQKSHHVTTFHTTPFCTGSRKKLLHFLSPRHQLLEFLERRELKSHSVKAVVPVSGILLRAIRQKHLAINAPLKEPIHPGVLIKPVVPKDRNPPPKNGGTIGFMGREWKRKGLHRVIEIWRFLKIYRPDLSLKVAGFPVGEFSDKTLLGEEGLQVLGWIEDKETFFKEIDLLIHPAKMEAFGMVIAEALTSCVPVLCSTECGASEIVRSDQGKCIPVNASTEIWGRAAAEFLDKPQRQSSYSRSWCRAIAG